MLDSTVHDPIATALGHGEARLLRPDDPAWGDALARCDHDIYQRPEYVVLDAKLAGDVPVAFWYRERSHVFLLPLTLRRIPGSDLRDAISPYGYPGPVSDAPAGEPEFWRRAAHALVRTLRANAVVTAFVRLHPLLPAPVAALAEVGAVVDHGETVSADLSLSVEEMWHQTRSDHRNHINRARRAGVSVVWDDWDRLDEWVAVYHGNMRRLGASDYYFVSAAHIAEMRETLGDRIHLCVAVHDGEVLGGNTFFEYRGFVQGYLASTRRENNHHADKLLYDEVRRWAKSRGNRIFHVGGGVGGAKDSLFAYKAGFSAGRHPFHTWRVVSDPDAYAVLLARTGRTPADAQPTGHFPPYR